MTPPHKISTVMYKLLIERKMDGFSVTEARDASLTPEDSVHSLEQARKKVYRQIWQYQQKGWLRSEGTGRHKRYFQTEILKSLKFRPKKSNEPEAKVNRLNRYSILLEELSVSKEQLETSLGEVDECHLIKDRFPELEDQIHPLLEKAREKSAQLSGKINVLTHVLQAIRDNKPH
ncbi:hypothetical protein ACPUEJ_00460 [Vibrio tubiashii]|uniref:hypothetical protein n=1 Tax=Vibrio tubiashii TaxID=29498 RepID=UPI003CE4664B